MLTFQRSLEMRLILCMLHEIHDLQPYCLLWCSFSCSCVTLDGGLEIEYADLALHNTNIVVRNFWFVCFVFLNLLFPSSPSSSLLSNSLPPSLLYPQLSFLPLLLFPPFPRPGWTWSYMDVSTVCYYHLLEFRSNLLVLEPPVLISVSLLCMHLCIHPLFPMLVLVFHLKLVHIKATSSQSSVLQTFRLIDYPHFIRIGIFDF